MVVVILFFVFPVPSSAEEIELMSVGDVFYMFGSMVEWGALLACAELSDLVLGSSGTGDYVFQNSPFYCPVAASLPGESDLHSFEGNVFFNLGNCVYCGLAWSDYKNALMDAEDEYVDSLSPSIDLPLYLSPDCIDALDSALEKGTVLSYSASANYVSLVIGEAYGTYSSYGGGGYTYHPSLSTVGIWYSDVFTVPVDGVYEVTWPGAVSVGAYAASISVQKYYEAMSIEFTVLGFTVSYWEVYVWSILATVVGIMIVRFFVE